MLRALRLLVGASALAAFAVASGGVRVAHAYPPPPNSAVLAASCTGTSPGGASCTVTFTDTGPNGDPQAGVQATFTVSGCGSVSPTSAITNSSGQASTTFTPPAASSSCCGTTTITATGSDGTTAQTTINIACVPKTTPGIPNTVGLPAGSTLPPSSPGSGGGIPSWAFGLLGGCGVLMLASVGTLRRARRRA